MDDRRIFSKSNQYSKRFSLIVNYQIKKQILMIQNIILIIGMQQENRQKIINKNKLSKKEKVFLSIKIKRISQILFVKESQKILNMKDHKRVVVYLMLNIMDGIMKKKLTIYQETQIFINNFSIRNNFSVFMKRKMRRMQVFIIFLRYLIIQETQRIQNGEL